MDACEFQVNGRPKVRGLPSEVRALIEEAQPFKTEPTHPKFVPLAFLADLSNADKHRELSAVAATVSVPGYGYDGPESDMRFTDSGEGRDLHDGTKVMAFTVTGPRADQVEVGPFSATRYAWRDILLGVPLSASHSQSGKASVSANPAFRSPS